LRAGKIIKVWFSFLGVGLCRYIPDLPSFRYVPWGGIAGSDGSSIFRVFLIVVLGGGYITAFTKVLTMYQI
jgi:hypothetical protein